MVQVSATRFHELCRRAGRFAAAAFVIALVAAPVTAFEEWHNDVDYTTLKNARPSLETGAGVYVAQIEAYAMGLPSGPNSYYIDLNNGEFAGIIDHDGSGGKGTNYSGHSTNVGQRFYGDVSSVAPGVPEVTLFEANNWLQNALNVDNTPGDASHPGPPVVAPPSVPLTNPIRVQNHSWVATYASIPQNSTEFYKEDPRNVDALGRFDYLLDTANGGAGLTAAVGLFNDNGQLPYLLGHSFNAIVVGRTDGGHSRGGTNVYDMIGDDDTYFPLRLKPDIVAPRPQSIFNNSTSIATAMVSSTAAMMYEAAAGTDAAHAEVIKAMILAGATKNEFANYIDPVSQPVPNAPHPWSRTPTRPLDSIFGAGELNVYNTYLTNLGGQRPGVQGVPAVAAGSYGWDYQNFKSQPAVGDISYKFQVPVGSTATEFSIILAWNVEVEDDDLNAGNGFKPEVTLQNLNLRLFNSLGGVVDESLSTLDNVEHIYRTNLGAGEYTLKVLGAADWDYGLAWRMTTQFNVMTADFNANGFVDGSDFLAWQRNFGTLLGATRADGDYNGDGDVDYFDLAGFSSNQLPASLAMYGSASIPGSQGSGAAIPEPATLAAALLAAPLLTWPLRKRARFRRA